MYNPSKKITALLSKYLEFDPEQLKLGIWSGNLSLTDVSLREEAIYPLLNEHLERGRSPTDGAHGASDNDGVKYAKPPVRFKLVSSTVGTLEMKIPWKRLVWGPGDVELKLANVLIIVSLENVEETEQRLRREAQGDGGGSESHDGDSDGNDNGDDENELFPDLEVAESGLSKKSRRETKVPPQLVREMKQSRLREAERRHLEGRLYASWLENARKKDEAKIAKILSEGQADEENVGRLHSFLNSATKGFAWRFFSGLVMTVENMKLVMVQDDVELGVILPSIQISTKKSGGSTQRRDTPVGEANDTAATPPGDVVYKGAYDDGEHVDKLIKLLGVGVYIRNDPAQSKQSESSRFAADVSTKQFVLRPVDLTYEYTLFYPHPPDKRKKATLESKSVDQTATTAGESDGCSTSAGSSKRRRGKRDKLSVPDMEQQEQRKAAAGMTNENPSDPVAPPGVAATPGGRGPPRPGPLALSSRPGTMGSTTGAPSSMRRRQSMAVSMRATPSRQATYRSRTAAAPLVRQEDIGGAYASATTGRKALVARFDSKLSIGAIEVVCSTRHYDLACSFFASCACTRNGRPRRTIRSLLEGGRVAHRSLTVRTPARAIVRKLSTGEISANKSASVKASMGPSSRGVVRIASIGEASSSSNNPLAGRASSSDLELHLQIQALDERSKVIRLWWRYALRTVVWQLRERKRLRENFQRRFLYFSWESQRYKRKEYVSLYIRIHLDKGFHPVPLSISNRSAEDELLDIEDELSIEQIILYRSLARAVFVRGGHEMPASILDLHDNSDGLGALQANADSSKGKTGGKRKGKSTRDLPSALMLLEKYGETARWRQDASTWDSLPPYKSLSSGIGAGLLQPTASVYDETTIAHTVDMRSVQAARRRAFNVNGISESENSTMLISFSMNMEKLDVVVVEELDCLRGLGGPQSFSSGESSQSRSKMEGSDVSVLTDDQRFFGDEGEFHASASELEDVEETPILSSTDFLLFEVPENVLLRIGVSPLVLSVLARSGGSRNINLKIGKVKCSGEEDLSLLSIGSRENVPPVPEIALEKRPVDRPKTSMIPDAVSMSLIVNKSGNILQCDTATINARIEMKALHKLHDFYKFPSASFPGQVVPSSGREWVRLYLLRQRTGTTSALNSSLRVQGIEILVPVLDATSKSMVGKGLDSDSERDGSSSQAVEGPNVVFRSGIIELYSGSAVGVLGVSANDFQYAGTPSSIPDDTPLISNERTSSQTRSLRMLNVTQRTATRSSILSHHWVSLLRFNTKTKLSSPFLIKVVFVILLIAGDQYLRNKLCHELQLFYF